MKKIYLFAFAAMAALQVQAQSATQDTYVGAALATEDLNGTARYVGMGGAMDALGADISTMGSNPAGIGLFRRGQVSRKRPLRGGAGPGHCGIPGSRFA